MQRLDLLFPAAVACALPAATVNHPAEIARSVTIYRDTYGVPHIFGPTDASCVFGYAYAQAEENFWHPSTAPAWRRISGSHVSPRPTDCGNVVAVTEPPRTQPKPCSPSVQFVNALISRRGIAGWTCPSIPIFSSSVSRETRSSTRCSRGALESRYGSAATSGCAMPARIRRVAAILINVFRSYSRGGRLHPANPSEARTLALRVKCTEDLIIWRGAKKSNRSECLPAVLSLPRRSIETSPDTFRARSKSRKTGLGAGSLMPHTFCWNAQSARIVGRTPRSAADAPVGYTNL